MYAFLDRHYWDWLKKKIENLTRTIRRDWINNNNKNLTKSPDSDDLTVHILPNLTRWKFLANFQNKKEEMLPSSSFEDVLALLPKRYKDITNKLTDQYSLWIIMQKNLNKILANLIQYHARIIHWSSMIYPRNASLV